MKCDICGSEKNVRQFGISVRPYTECSKCFERTMKLGVLMYGGKLTKEILEALWNKGIKEK